MQKPATLKTRWNSSLRTRSMQDLFLHHHFLKLLLLARKRYATDIMITSLVKHFHFHFPKCSLSSWQESKCVLFQVNGAPPSECGGGEEDAGASYVELGQGGQEVMMLVMMKMYCWYCWYWRTRNLNVSSSRSKLRI